MPASGEPKLCRSLTLVTLPPLKNIIKMAFPFTVFPRCFLFKSPGHQHIYVATRCLTTLTTSYSVKFITWVQILSSMPVFLIHPFIDGHLGWNLKGYLDVGHLITNSVVMSAWFKQHLSTILLCPSLYCVILFTSVNNSVSQIWLLIQKLWSHTDEETETQRNEKTNTGSQSW